METTSLTKHQKNLSAAIHISTFSKYFIPFGNFILPLILWTSNKNDSSFVDENGKHVLNFQISILLYSITLGVIAFVIALFTAWDMVGFINVLDHNEHDVNFKIGDIFEFGSHLFVFGFVGLLWLGLFIADVVCSIIGALRANDGVVYQYPLTINFIK